jgi:cellulose synthase/poly-beta-1,6-N-acetylglucosamine synthase-like glycosyltransferase
MWVLLIIMLLLLSCYALMVTSLATGIRKTERKGSNSTSRPPSVSVLVPFRNEQQHLPSLVKALSEQTCPLDRMEVLFINDHSEDGSVPLLLEMIIDGPRFRFLDLPPGREGKKMALEMGIEQAAHEWIIQLDADGTVGPGFVESHAAFCRDTGADLVAGWVILGESTKGWTGPLERLDLLSLAGVAAGSFALGRPLVCSGANLAFSRSLYRESRLFDPGPEVASGDDMFLMIGARKLGRKLAFLQEPAAVVRTVSAGGLASLIRQRIRWGAKSTRFRMADIQGTVVLTLLTQLVVLAAPWICLLYTSAWIMLVPGCMVKILADFILLYRTAKRTGQERALWMYLPVLPLYYPFQGAVLAGVLFGRGSWKGRNK